MSFLAPRVRYALSRGDRGGRERIVAGAAHALLLFAVGMAACSGSANWPLTRRAERAVGTTRATVARFSAQSIHQRCEAGPRCAASVGTDSLLTISADVARAMAERPTADAAAASALLEALGTRGAGNRIDRSLSLYEMAIALSDSLDAPWVDLAAARLVRAAETQRGRDVIEALDAAEHAVTLHPDDRAARFNHALALEMMTLDGEAQEAWRAYLSLDDSSGWASEARTHLAAIEPAAVREPALEAEPTAWTAFAMADPGRARELGLTRVLGAWGESFGVDATRAARSLEVARAIGTTLTAQGGDGTLASAVSAIDAASAATRARLAHAQVAFRAAQTAFAAQAFPTAVAMADTVVAMGSPSMRQWARLLIANTMVLRGDLAGAARELPRIVAEATSPAQRVLRGRALWSVGTTAARQGRYGDALEALVDADSLFARTHELESQGAVREIQGATYLAMGAEDRGFDAERRAAMTLRTRRSSPWLHNVLYSTSRAALARGRTHAASAINREGRRVATRIDRPILLIEAHLLAARRAAADGDDATARRELDETAPLVAGLPAAVQRTFRAEWQLADAMRLAPRAPERAVAALDSVLAVYAAQGNAGKMMQTLAQRAGANLTRGRTMDVTRDLDSLAAMGARNSRTVGSAADREALRAIVQEVSERLVRLRLIAGDSEGALAAVNRLHRMTSGSQPSDAQTLTLALAGDRMGAWRGPATARRWIGWRIDRAKFDAAIARVRTAVELGGSRAALDADLAMLHDMIWRPLLPLIGADSTLSIVRDGALAAVPFAALRDESRGQYVVERWTLQFVEAGGVVPNVSAAPTLIVQAPTADASLGLAPLPGAREEAARVSALVSAPRLLAGDSATRERLLADLPTASVVHVAGHAVLDDARPDESGLVIAARPGASPMLRAADIAALDLHQVSLVVLSACETWRSPRGAGRGLLSLGDAFLRAGAGGVIASLWRVDDRATLALMTALHGARRGGRLAPAALRDAQLQLLRGADAAQRSPAAWAGFAYSGRDASLHP